MKPLPFAIASIFLYLAHCVLVGPRLSAAAENQHGDRQLAVHIRYPAHAYFHEGKGGTVLDITKPPFNAKGDGVTDDTAAFVRAYDFILTEQDKSGYNAAGMINTDKDEPNQEGYPITGPKASADGSFIIYLPNGDYRVSDTLIYSMADRTPSTRRAVTLRRGVEKEFSTGWEQLVWVRFVGESRNKTIIRLADAAPGFGAGSEKAVIAFGKSHFNNRKALSCVHNLTIDTGRQNPGAVAIDFTGANSAQLMNLTLRSADGAGHAGILMKRPPFLGYNHDILVQGFDHGILCRVGHASAPVFEWITLRDQNKSGICLTEKAEEDRGHGEAFLVARRLKITGDQPALHLAGEGVHLVATECSFEGKGGVAVQLDAGDAYLREIQLIGYAAAIQAHGKSIAMMPLLQEWTSTPMKGMDGQAAFRLPVREAPLLPWPSSPAEWSTPEDHGAKADGQHDDTAAVQAAFDSGKPAVCLPIADYRLTAPIRVPASVHLVHGMFRRQPDLDLIVLENAEAPVVFTQFYGASLSVECTRPVSTEFAQITYKNTIAAKGGVYFCQNGSYPTKSKNPAGIDFFGRSVNNEANGLPLPIRGGRVWMLGFKTERGPVLRVSDAAQVEILGATFGVKSGNAKEPTVEITDSQVTLVASKTADSWDKNQVVIKQTINGVEQLWQATDLPARRTGQPGYALVPMFTTGRPK